MAPLITINISLYHLVNFFWTRKKPDYINYFPPNGICIFFPGCFRCTGTGMFWDIINWRHSAHFENQLDNVGFTNKSNEFFEMIEAVKYFWRCVSVVEECFQLIQGPSLCNTSTFKEQTAWVLRKSEISYTWFIYKYTDINDEKIIHVLFKNYNVEINCIHVEKHRSQDISLLHH